MGTIRIAALSAHFGRDIGRTLDRLAGLVERLAGQGVDLLVLPDSTLGGYIGDLRNPDPSGGPEALDPDGPEIRTARAMAGPMTICLGYTEAAGPLRYNAAVCVSGDGVLGRHRKVHRPDGEHRVYAAGSEFAAFDTPVGRMGMLIDYDKTFPESARTLALNGASIVAALSAWPASVTDPAARMPNDRQARLFDLYDLARAAENQVVLVSANQTGTTGRLRFLGQSKIVGPGGEVLAKTWTKGGLAIADVDVEQEIARARLILDHLAERRVDTYAPVLRSPET